MVVTVSPDYESLSTTAASQIGMFVAEVADEQSTVTLALAGGSTPRRAYELLADATLPWSQLHLFWGDERFVPHDHPESNVRLVRESLLDRAPVPDENVHPVPTDGRPEDAAGVYERTLRNRFADRSRTFDLVILGMGTDGHTASLFPEQDPSPSDSRWVRAVTAPPPHEIRRRITCTLPALNRARQAFVLVSGQSKRETVRAALVDKNERLPVTRIRPREKLVWLLDEAARPSAVSSS